MKKELKGFIKFIYCDRSFHFITILNPFNSSQIFTYHNWDDCFIFDKIDVEKIIKRILDSEEAEIIETDLK